MNTYTAPLIVEMCSRLGRPTFRQSGLLGFGPSKQPLFSNDDRIESILIKTSHSTIRVGNPNAPGGLGPSRVGACDWWFKGSRNSDKPETRSDGSQSAGTYGSPVSDKNGDTVTCRTLGDET